MIVFFGFVLLDSLLLFMLVALRGRGYWAAKAIMIVLVLGFNFFIWSQRGSGQGWPVEAPLPVPNQFVSCIVQEPDQLSKNPGAIYLWVIPLESKHGVIGYKPGNAEPRAFKEKYDRSLHEACVKASKAASSGTPVGIKKLGKGKHRSVAHRAPGRYVPYVLPHVNNVEKG